MNSGKHWLTQAYSLYAPSHMIFTEAAEGSIMIPPLQMKKPRSTEPMLMKQGLKEP